MQTIRHDDSTSLATILASSAGRRVLVVGDFVADHYIYGQTDRVSREAPVLIVRYESSEVKLGGAGNAAANLAALGAQVTAVGLVGRDEMGGEIENLCRQAQIRLVTPTPGSIPTEAKTRILAGGHHTRRQQMLRLDRSNLASLPEPVEAELAALVTKLASEADAVLVSDYGAGVLGEKVIAATMALARAGIPVCVDSRYNLGAFKGATVLKPNEPELAALMGMRVDTEAELIKVMHCAQERFAGSALVVTRGRNGMAVTEREDIAFIPVHGPSEAVDVTGAGDTVGATLTLALAAKASLYAAARLANVAGALKVQKSGTATVSAAELAQELAAVEKS